LLDKTERTILRTEMKKREINSEQLSILLKEKEGVSIKKLTLETKLSRGNFSSKFFLQCLSALGVESLDFKEYF
jgi:hypothetical protein